jgi:OmcA/MtrC family decaheme c-type cytochrome
VKDKTGAAVPLNTVTRLGIVLAGPTSDYSRYWAENALTATEAGGGRYVYTFTAAIPADARGSYTIGLEGYKNVTLLEGTTRQLTVRDAGLNVQRTFAVDGSAVQQRRQVVSLQKCNACHDFLSLHGGNRNSIEQCVMCHNPNETDAARRPADRMPAESINFSTMIHRIHSGNQQTRPFSIYGFGNVEHDYSHAGFPGIRSECSICHVNNSHRLPVADGLLPVTDPRGYVTKPGPEASACTGCHASKAAAAHASLNTSPIGEACSACHGSTSQFSVDRVHAR